jgi:uncharacterized protein (DUF305 family)
MPRLNLTLSITLAAFVVAVALGFAVPITAETVDHSKMDMSAPELTGDETPATLAYMAANATMHTDMAIEYTGNADVDFIKSMIPHHQGAVEMAKIALANGTDPEVRKLAEAVIAAQEAEIKWMTDWLAKNGG